MSHIVLPNLAFGLIYELGVHSFSLMRYSECSMADPIFRSITEDSYLPEEERVNSNSIKNYLKSLAQ